MKSSHPAQLLFSVALAASCSLLASAQAAPAATSPAAQSAPAQSASVQSAGGIVTTGAVTTDPAAAGQLNEDPKLKLNPETALKAFEPSSGEEYELGPGDEISLDVPGHPELTGKHIVGPDGRITLPVGGTVDIANKTRLGASESIKEALTPYYVEPTVTLGIDKYGSNHVTVLGNVKNPGVLNFDSTPTLLEAISRSGLAATGASKDGIPETCMIYRANSQVVQVDLRSLLTSGNGLANMRLRRNDLIFVPTQKDQFVSVMGEVNKPGAIPLTPGLSLHQALAEAGGKTDLAGKNISIIQAATNKTITISYNQMLTPNGDREITLHAGDIIAIPRSGFGKATAFLQKISPIATMVTIGALL